MRALLASPLGLVVGLALGALGGGGSIVAVPVLVYVAGQAPSDATTTSLLVVGTAAVVGIVGHARAGRVRFLAGAIVGLTGIAGSLAGSALNRSIDANLLLLGFGLRNFSMHPAHLLTVKQRVLATSLAEIAPLVTRILRAEDPEKLASLLEKLNAP